MVRLFIRHNVEDYEAWRKAYDEFDEQRRSMGVSGDAVFSRSKTRTTSPPGTTSIRLKPHRPLSRRTS
jgi:hypothetical protein